MIPVPGVFRCYNAPYMNQLIQKKNVKEEGVVSIYVCLYRKKDGEAWRVVKAFSVGPRDLGTQLIYCDDSIRHFRARVISKAEYETFKIFEKIGKE